MRATDLHLESRQRKFYNRQINLWSSTVYSSRILHSHLGRGGSSFLHGPDSQTAMMDSTSFVLALLFFAVSALAQLSGSDSCLTNECQALLLLCSECSFPLQTTADITPTQSQCICYSTNFSETLGTYVYAPCPMPVSSSLPFANQDRCLTCMELHEMANFSRPTWDRLCADTSNGQLSSNVQDSDLSTKITGGTENIAHRHTGCVVGSLLVAVGIGYWI